ncbi:hypothetical protein [Arthrobacter sp. GMC3]|uniref:hypothetical protein n=1 Tax=Arthrobacter sp. GMC3 TaxID=2058894 RepID=UPI000CE4D308|nr:hypothetical protein [Arthrobacter sp. GMC3]
MRAINLETRVLAAVDQIRKGQQVETDFIECKREWPEDKKARQLAGSLNRAAGDPVIYIIGLDDKTGVITDVSGTDVLDWWTQIRPKFDQTPPELARHMDVVVDANGDKVVALVFASDRAPYVVKTGSANPSLEIPIREGSGTRSARRDEILRMLMPTINVPNAVVLEATFGADRSLRSSDSRFARQAKDETEGMRCLGGLKLYFEHTGTETVTLPSHGMRGKISADGVEFKTNFWPLVLPKDKEDQQSHGAVAKYDGIVVTSPGLVRIGFRIEDVNTKDRHTFLSAKLVVAELELEVIGAARSVKVVATLTRLVENRSRSEYQESLGNWKYVHPV